MQWVPFSSKEGIFPRSTYLDSSRRYNKLSDSDSYNPMICKPYQNLLMFTRSKRFCFISNLWQTPIVIFGRIESRRIKAIATVAVEKWELCSNLSPECDEQNFLKRTVLIHTILQQQRVLSFWLGTNAFLKLSKSSLWRTRVSHQPFNSKPQRLSLRFFQGWKLRIIFSCLAVCQWKICKQLLTQMFWGVSSHPHNDISHVSDMEARNWTHAAFLSLSYHRLVCTKELHAHRKNHRHCEEDHFL